MTEEDKIVIRGFPLVPHIRENLGRILNLMDHRDKQLYSLM